MAGWILLAFLLAPISDQAQDNRMRLKQAKVLENVVIKGQAVQKVSGNVIFTRGITTLSCDRAQYNDREKQATLAGNVVVTKANRNLTCDSLFYDSRLDVMKTFGRTHVWDKDYDLKADALIYYSEIDSGNASGKVILLQKEQDIRAREMTYVKKPGENAVSYTAIGDVVIVEGERRATCGKAIYNRSRETTFLTETPEIKDSTRTISGSEIYLFYRKENLVRMTIPSRAKALSSAAGWQKTGRDSTAGRKPVAFTDELTGNSMRAYFHEGDMDSLILEGMATTRYHVFEDSLFQGKNIASGDVVQMRFANDELEVITIRGGARGTYTPDPSNSSLEGPISYESDWIVYTLNDESTQLIRKAAISHAATNLTSGYVNVDWNTSLLYAHPRLPGDTLTPPRKPTLLEKGKEPMTGEFMVYNLKTRKGQVTKGRTKAQDGFYAGQEIRNEGTDKFYIAHSVFTTCDLEDPHFDFRGRRMKVIQNDKVIVRPLVFEIQHIPLFGIPFAILPHQGGRRHSGWIMPSYGDNRNRGQYLDGLGYYWATNDYMDVKMLFGFADKQGFRMRNLLRYKKRYQFTGSLHLEGKWLLSGGQNNIMELKNNLKKDFVVKWSHSQTLRNDQSLRANVSYYSNGEYNYQTGIDQTQRMDQRAQSNITYSKRWKKSGNSLSATMSANQDLMVAEKTNPNSVFYVAPTRAGTKLSITNASLPGLQFRRGQSYLFKSRSGKNRWYNNISWNYGSSLTRKVQTYYESEAYLQADSTTGYRWDQKANGQLATHTDENSNILHSYSLSAPFKIFRYITVNPDLTMRTNWVDRSFSAVLDTTKNLLTKIEVPGLASRTTGSFSLNFKTQIYGLFPLNLGRLAAVRHTISPTIGYRYTPDYSKAILGWDPGYIVTLRDTAGNKIQHDRFQGTAAGSTPTREQQSMTLSLNNVFKGKWGEPGHEKKIDLLSWNMGTSYNFAAEEFQWSNLNSSIRSHLGSLMNIDLNLVHSFYEPGVSTLHRTAGGIPVPRLLSTSFNTGFKCSGKRWADAAKPDTEELDSLGNEIGMDLFPNKGPESSGGPIGGNLWDCRFSINYTVNKSNPDNVRKTFWVNGNANLNVTRTWRVGYSARFDMTNASLVSHNFTISKDLHCWEMSFNWTPTGYGSGYFLKINVKSPVLRDIKLEDRGGIYGRRSGF